MCGNLKQLSILAATLLWVAPLYSQEAGKKENDGLDPTSPARSAKISYEHLDLNVPAVLPGDGSNTLLFEYQQPFGHNAVKFKLPVAVVNVAGNNDPGLGDISAKLTHVIAVTRTYGMVANLELVLDTASRPELGTGKTVLKPGFTYARFLKGGHIFAPALVHSVSIAGSGRRSDINSSTVDFYLVPRLANKNLYMTLDPAVTLDWEHDKQFLTTALTVGCKLGPMLGGNGQVSIKPSFGVGGDRATDWGVQFGFQLLNF